jgi:hypothetical protein
VSGTPDRVGWNAELVRGDMGKAVQRLKRESGITLYNLFANVDNYRRIVQPCKRHRPPRQMPATPQHGKS